MGTILPGVEISRLFFCRNILVAREGVALHMVHGILMILISHCYGMDGIFIPAKPTRNFI